MTAPTSNADRLIADVKALQPLLRARAAEGERQRYPIAEVFDRLEEVGSWRAFLPQRWGGLGLSASEFTQVQIELARGDLSIAWTSHIINGMSWLASQSIDHVQEALFNHGPAKVVGAVNPPGRIVRVEGGYRLTGAFPYSSACRQSEWFLCAAKVEGVEDAKPIILYASMQDATVVDSWYVAGLQGTGSDTCSFTDAFIPDERVVPPPPAPDSPAPERKHRNAASDFLPAVPTVRTLCVAQLIGGAEEMVRIVTEEAGKRSIVATIYARQADSAVFQHHLGEASAKIAAARLIVEDAARQLDAYAAAGSPVAPADAGANKAIIGIALDLILGAIDRLMTISGSHAFNLSNPLQQYWRDIHVAARHVQVLPQLGYEIHGRHLLGFTDSIAPSGTY